jgi:hypothetical protein
MVGPAHTPVLRALQRVLSVTNCGAAKPLAAAPELEPAAAAAAAAARCRSTVLQCNS